MGTTVTFTKTEWPCISKMRAQHKEVRFSVTSEEVPGEGGSGKEPEVMAAAL